MPEMKKVRIGIIGCGNMGEAIARGVRAARKAAVSLAVSEADPAKRKRIRARYKIRVLDDNARLVARSDVVILAVKPRDIPAVLREIAPRTRLRQLIISVAAGVSTRAIEDAFAANVPVVRGMPNMPALVGAGISAVSPGRYARRSHMRTARAIFAAVGDVVEVEERLLDAVTALSGSGPAYFFYLVESMMEAARELGIDARSARLLAVKTALGSAHILDRLGDSPEDLRAKVTSKGGTTEAAFKVFESKGLKAVVKKGIRAACERARELRTATSV